MKKDKLILDSKTMSTEIYAAWLALFKEPMDDLLVDIGESVRNMFADAWGKRFNELCGIFTIRESVPGKAWKMKGYPVKMKKVPTTLVELTFTPVDKERGM